MKIKYYLSLIVFLFSLIKVSATFACMDTTYVYSYDDSGNRIDRTIDFTKSAHLPNDNASSFDEDIIEEVLSDFEIHIYPNPTKGKLKVELTGIDDKKARILLLNIQGNTLINKNISNKINTIDLTRFPAGIYILRVSLEQSTSEWKILKN